MTVEARNRSCFLMNVQPMDDVQTSLVREDENIVRGRAHAMRAGTAGGFVATLAMTAFVWGGQKIGALGEFPPSKIVRKMRRRAGIFGAPKTADRVATAAAHVAFGIAAGALFGAFYRRHRGPARSAFAGATYGAAVWAASYYGWVPALGLLNEPRRDRPFRPTTMFLGHLLFGTVLGTMVDARLDSRRASIGD
jgi:hypothetical protein